MPEAPIPIITTSNAPGQPYDAASDAPVVGWVKAGSDLSPDEPGAGSWRQVLSSPVASR